MSKSKLRMSLGIGVVLLAGGLAFLLTPRHATADAPEPDDSVVAYVSQATDLGCTVEGIVLVSPAVIDAASGELSRSRTASD